MVRKLEARAQKMIFIGYDRDYTYKVLDPVSGITTIARDVMFDESRSYYDNQNEYKELGKLTPRDETFSESEGEELEAENVDLLDVDEPRTFKEAMRSSHSTQWRDAVDEELRSLDKNKTWQLVELPTGKRVIESKWVFKLKKKADGSIDRYKARLVAKGYSQRKGMDYEETFSPEVRLDSVRIILALSAVRDLEIIHFDVRTAFLYGTLSEEVYMRAPEGFNSGGKVCKLLKSIHGLKQASRVWNSCFVSFLRKFQLEPLTTDSCVLVRRSKEVLIIAIYVDDGLVCCSGVNLLRSTMEYLQDKFEIAVAEAQCYVGLQLKRDRANRTLTLHQPNYIDQVVKRFGMEEADVSSIPMYPNVKLIKNGITDGDISREVDVPYRELIGFLMYLSVGSRPDIACAVSILSRFLQAPKLPHWKAAKNVLRYLNATKNHGLVYRGEELLVGFSDADYASCRDTRKSITGIVIKLCSAPVVLRATK